MGLHPPRHGPARAVPAPPSARGVPGAGCRRGRPPRPPTSVLTHEGSDVGRGARPARPSGLTHQVRLSDVPRRGRAAEDVGPYHRSRPTDRSPPRPTDRSPPQPTDHRPVRCVIRPCSRRGFGDERDFTSERSEVKSRIGPPVCAYVKKRGRSEVKSAYKTTETSIHDRNARTQHTNSYGRRMGATFIIDGVHAGG